MGFLDLSGKSFLVMGVANRKSIAAHVARLLLEEGGRVFLSVKDAMARENAARLFPGVEIFLCDVEKEEEIARLAAAVGKSAGVLHGLVHSIAYANFADGLKPFHETRREDFLQAMNISMFSLVAICNHLKHVFAPDASVVTISISTTTMASPNYGYMAPVKAALDSAICFLAKSFAEFSRVRFNAVKPALLKTSASAGIPGYLENYLYAEQVVLRKEAVKTEEVANAVVFLLSPRASGINGQGIVVDAGMGLNYFDRDIVRKVVGSAGEKPAAD
ncbi:MAG: SDR family oxidoreductase [Planctomycetota bacterium]|nr:SDR family oxidoreductase [Planctomycetota bacterium]